jgi:hypothetical protein
MLHQGRTSDRCHVALALGALGQSIAVAPLIEQLQTAPSDVRRAASRSLLRLGYQPTTDEVAAFVVVFNGDIEAATRFGPTAYSPLSLILKEGQVKEQQQASECLRTLLPHFSSAELAALSHSPDTTEEHSVNICQAGQGEAWYCGVAHYGCPVETYTTITVDNSHLRAEAMMEIARRQV